MTGFSKLGYAMLCQGAAALGAAASPAAGSVRGASQSPTSALEAGVTIEPYLHNGGKNFAQWIDAKMGEIGHLQERQKWFATLRIIVDFEKTDNRVTFDSNAADVSLTLNEVKGTAQLVCKEQGSGVNIKVTFYERRGLGKGIVGSNLLVEIGETTKLRNSWSSVSLEEFAGKAKQPDAFGAVDERIHAQFWKKTFDTPTEEQDDTPTEEASLTFDTPTVDASLCAALSAGNIAHANTIIELVGELFKKDKSYPAESTEDFAQRILHKAAFCAAEAEVDLKKLANENRMFLLNGKDHRGMTPLHLAAEKFDLAAAKYFIAQGADRNAKSIFISGIRNDSFGWSPIYTAAYFGNFEVAEVLIETVGVDLEIVRNSNRETPLGAAARTHGRKTYRLVELLLEHGAKVDAVNKLNATPLISAIEYGDINAMKVLIRHNALVPALRDEEEYNHLVDIARLAICNVTERKSPFNYSMAPADLKSFLRDTRKILQILNEARNLDQGSPHQMELLQIEDDSASLLAQ